MKIPLFLFNSNISVLDVFLSLILLFCFYCLCFPKVFIPWEERCYLFYHWTNNTLQCQPHRIYSVNTCWVDGRINHQVILFPPLLGGNIFRFMCGAKDEYITTAIKMAVNFYFSIYSYTPYACHFLNIFIQLLPKVFSFPLTCVELGIFLKQR